MSWLDRFLRKQNSPGSGAEPTNRTDEPTEPNQANQPNQCVEPTEPVRTEPNQFAGSAVRPMADQTLLLEVGRQRGLREQKLEEIHEDIRFIRDKMALQNEIDEMRAEVREKLVRLAELGEATKQLILERLQAAAEPTEPVRTGAPNQPNQCEPVRRTGANQPNQCAGSPLETLSQREKETLSLLLEHGALTYEEIATKLNTNAAYAKNLVNRILRKSDILYKEKVENRNVVSVRPGARQQSPGSNTPDPAKDGL